MWKPDCENKHAPLEEVNRVVTTPGTTILPHRAGPRTCSASVGDAAIFVATRVIDCFWPWARGNFRSSRICRAGGPGGEPPRCADHGHHARIRPVSIDLPGHPQRANRFPEVDFVYPVHLNPNVRDGWRFLADRDNVHLMPLAICRLWLMDRSWLI